MENLFQIQNILENNDKNRFREVFLDLHDFDKAQVIEELSTEEFLLVCDYLTADEFASFCSFLETSMILNVFNTVDESYAVSILRSMDFDDAVDILEEFAEADREKYLGKLNSQEKREFTQFLSYDPDSAGALMSNSYIVLNKDMEIKEAMKKVVSAATEVEIINVLYVVDNKKIVGVMSLRELIIARSPHKIEEVMNKNVITSYYDEDKEDVARKVKDYDLGALPVIDYDNNILGIITVDDVIDVIEEVATEDYAKMAGLAAIEEDRGRDSVYNNIKNRLPWLLILLGVGCFTAFMMASFENTIKNVAVLTFFLPLILSMAGNTGTQSLAVTIRYITSDYFTSRKDVIAHLWKEVRIGFFNGIIISIVVFLLLNSFGLIFDIENSLLIAAVVSISIIVTLTVSTLAGSVIPLLIDFFKGDAAVASGPFISTINDIIAVTIFLVLATFLILPFL